MFAKHDKQFSMHQTYKMSFRKRHIHHSIICTIETIIQTFLQPEERLSDEDWEPVVTVASTTQVHATPSRQEDYLELGANGVDGTTGQDNDRESTVDSGIGEIKTTSKKVWPMLWCSEIFCKCNIYKNNYLSL